MPLMEVASAGRIGVAKLLIEHRAKVNTPSNEFKKTALTLAAYKGESVTNRLNSLILLILLYHRTC